MISLKDKVSAVVVFYERELDMLSLLARSFNIYLDETLFDEVIFIDNSFEQPDLKSRFEAKVLSEMPRFARCVKYIYSADLGVELANREDGYRTQQVVKLEVAKVVNNAHYLLFDAKNHLIKRLDRAQLFHHSGMPLSEYVVHSGYLEQCRKHSFDVWKVTLEDQQKCLPTVTPYLMITKLANQMLEAIANVGLKSVDSIIAANKKCTEFLLYAGWLLTLAPLEHFYAARPRPSATLFARWPEQHQDVVSVLNRSRHDKVYSLGVHANRYVQLTSEQAVMLSELWLDAGLFANLTECQNFIKRQFVQYGKAGEQGVDVIVGNGGRLSLGQGTNNYLDQHLGLLTLSEDDVQRWKYTLELRDAWCKVRDISYAYLICPDTISVHVNDFLQQDAQLRPVMKLLAASSDFSPIYPLGALMTARRQGVVCNTVDSHWSPFGAYVAYQQLQAQYSTLLKKFDADELSIKHNAVTGDLGDKFSIKLVGEQSGCAIKKPLAKLIWNNGVNNRGYMGLWANYTKPDLPRAVIFMDSYGWKIQSFLAESFSFMFVVHTPFFEWEAVELVKPDFVMNLQAERFILRVPDDHSPEKALFTAKTKDNAASWPDFKSFGL